MTAPYRRSTGDSVVRNHDKRISILEAVPGGASPCGDWVEPTLLNSWTNAGAPYDDIAYRICEGNTLEFKGHITGGVSGSIAFILDVDYRPEADLSTVTDRVTGGTPGIAQIYVTASTGAVTVTTII
jgi:hypothetical protein